MSVSTSEYGPEYYKRGKIQVWDFIRDQELSFHLGNVIKYVCRAGYKDNDLQDLKKALHYLENEIEFRTSQRIQEGIQCDQLVGSKFEEFAKEFDR